jgi:SIR2-like domain
MSINFNKNILLTGAGFTANFGGVLAREMWSKILNNPKMEKLPEIKKLLMDNFDFESIYSEVINSSRFTPEDKALFQQIVLDGFNGMDETLKQFCNTGFNQYGAWWSGVTTFLTSLGGSQSEPSVHFTLNQDLLLERAKSGGGIPLGITAVKYREYWDSLFAGQIDLSRPITLYDQAGLQEFIEKHLSSCDFHYYIKLHGSQGWLSSDGKNQMVMGTNKIQDINKEPLLKWYFDLFQEALFRKDVKLFVIGYGFRDEHINECLLKAINEYGLKLYIISPEDPEKFRNRMKKPEGSGDIYEISKNYKIWEAVNGYFPYKLKDIFPQDQTETQVAINLKKILN